MKKIIKSLIVIVIIACIAVGGVYGGYRYKQSKKFANVVSLMTYGMDGYWGDSVESMGTVTSEKSQTVYMTTGTEILSVNFAAGDHVDEGDVLMTVKNESQNIKGKELEVQKALQTYTACVNKLERLENTEPIPEYIATDVDSREVTFVSDRTYTLKDGCSFMNYNVGNKVFAISYSRDGSELFRTYYSKDKQTYGLDDEQDKEEIEEIKSSLDGVDVDEIFDVEENSVTQEVVVGTFFYDGETGRLLGHEGIGPDGEITEKFKKPEGYTPTQLKEAVDTASKDLLKADLSLRIKQNQLEQMKSTNENGEILAKVSGTVSKVQNSENYNATQPFMIVSATDEYYISGEIGEFYLDSVNVGDTVSVMSWDNGLMADAVITEISDTPSTGNNSYYYGSGNTNVSNYEFKATFDRSSGIEIGSAVDITITPSGQEESNGLYISSYFIRKDSGGNYVMRMNEENKLEKVYVKIGKNLWGYMTEIKSGVTINDYLAFPYGDGAVEGMTCNITDSLDY